MHTFYADTVLPGYFLPEAVTESQKTVEGMHENRNKMFFFFFLVVVLEVGPEPHVC